MRLSSRRGERGRTIELSMTSMIDVVFLLLIFFVTNAAFVRTERNLASGIQAQDRASAARPRDLEPAIVDVVRGQQAFVFKMGAREFATAEELTAVLRSFDNKVDGAFVRVSDEAPFRMSAAAVQACKTAGFPLVSYIPVESNGEGSRE